MCERVQPVTTKLESANTSGAAQQMRAGRNHRAASLVSRFIYHVGSTDGGGKLIGSH
jgi:hypothetical protein